MRLARDYERAEGSDLRGFLAYAVTQDLAEAREGEAALESDGLDAVRLMTIHRAKGLEFPVVCVADLGRAAATVRDRLLVGPGGEVGLRLAPIGGGDAIPALAWERLAEAAKQAEDEEERRLFYVAMTRARERLILSGGVDRERLPAPRPGGPPIDWILRALGGEVQRCGDRRRARRRTAAVPRSTPPTRSGRAAVRRTHPGRTTPRGRARNRAPRPARRPARGPRPRPARPPAPLVQRARRLRPLRLPLLPRARAGPPASAAAGGGRGPGRCGGRGRRGRARPAGPRLARPSPARGARLRPARRASDRRGRGARRGVGAGADPRGARGRSRPRRRLRRLTAVRPPRPSATHPQRGPVHVHARRSRGRAAGHRLPRRRARPSPRAAC